MGRRARIAGAIVELMEQRGLHAWTLDELHASLASGGEGADFSSVFRSVARLESLGSLRRVALDDGKSRFELDGEHHDHMICDRCGAVAPVPCRVVDAGLGEVEAATGFRVLDHRLVLSGVCPECLAVESEHPEGRAVRA